MSRMPKEKRWRRAIILSVFFHIFALSAVGWMFVDMFTAKEITEQYVELELMGEQDYSGKAASPADSAPASEIVPPQKHISTHQPVVSNNTVPVAVKARIPIPDPEVVEPPTEPIVTQEVVKPPTEPIVTQEVVKPPIEPIATGEVSANVMTTVNIDAESFGGTGGSGTSAGTGTGGGNANSGKGTAEKGGDIRPPGILSKVEPQYPKQERQAGREGTVVLKIQILTDGRPGYVNVYSSSGRELLDNAAVVAVKRWRFIPAKDRNGRSFVSYTTMPVIFRLK